MQFALKAQRQLLLSFQLGAILQRQRQGVIQEQL
jgi:hypothetical protein